jgi:lactam utilization protein B
VHGDSPDAIAMAKTVREKLKAAGATVAPFGSA